LHYYGRIERRREGKLEVCISVASPCYGRREGRERKYR